MEDYRTKKMHNKLIKLLKVDRCYRGDISMCYLGGQLSEGHTPNPGGCPPEAHVNHLLMETQGLKDLGSLKIETRTVITRSWPPKNKNLTVVVIILALS